MSESSDQTTGVRDQKRTIMWVVVAILAIAALLPLYFYFDPAHSYLAPKCMFRLLTGLDCPSCGGQRALHSLLNGDVWLSIRYNPFLWLVVPYVVFVVVSSLFKHPAATRLYDSLTSRGVLLTYVAIYMIWWVVRNLPFWHSLVDLPH